MEHREALRHIGQRTPDDAFRIPVAENDLA
jgi:hypothetical protein